MYYKYTINPEGCTFSKESRGCLRFICEISFKMLIILTCGHDSTILTFSAHAYKYNINSTHTVMQEIHDTSFPLEFGMDPEESLSEHLLSLVVIPSRLACTTLDIQGQILDSSMICTIMKPQFKMPKG